MGGAEVTLKERELEYLIKGVKQLERQLEWLKRDQIPMYPRFTDDVKNLKTLREKLIAVKEEKSVRGSRGAGKKGER